MKRRAKSNDGTAKAAGPEALAPQTRVSGLNTEQQQACDEIRALLDGQRHAEAKVWYKVGEKVTVMVGDSAYGEKAVANLAKDLGRDPTVLYDAGCVAKTWLRQEFEDLVDRRDKVRGNRLSWSHFVELAGLSDPDRRDLLIEKSLSEGLSVRDLKKQIAGPKPKADQEDGQAMNVARALRNFKAASETIVTKASHWDALIFDVLKAQDEELATPRMLELLGDVRVAQFQAKQTCEEQLARLDACIARARKLMAGPATGRSLERPSDLVGSEVGDHE